jgi:3-hydroxybutyryl-CoA dehydrogenase
MRTLVFANPQQAEEFRQKFPALAQVAFHQNHNLSMAELGQADLIVDFTLAEAPAALSFYRGTPHVPLLIEASYLQLAALRHQYPDLANPLFGFCGLPGLLNRSLLEVSLEQESDRPQLDALMQNLGTDYAVVGDRVGMATPRIIAMIINEAYYTLQEGTASRADIDTSMKLGTNYPMGPFEWAQRWGVGRVYQLLHHVYEDTRDERYRICPLLKTEYLRQHRVA